MNHKAVQIIYPVKNRQEEIALILAAVCFFCVLASYYMVRPIREQFASAAGGSQALPLLYTLVFAAMLLLTPVYGALVSRFSRRIFVPLIYAFFVLCLLGMGPFFRISTDLAINSKVFYVWVSVFNLFVVSIFWSCMADVFDAEQSKRLYGYIALGGTAGAILGPILAKELVLIVGLNGLYLLASMFLFFALACLLALFARAPSAKAHEVSNEPLGGGIWEGALATFSDPLMRRMALLLLCADGVATILYSNLSDYAKTAFTDPVLKTEFFATVDLWTNGTQIVLQALVVRWLLAKAGAGRAMAWPNIFNAIILIAIAIYADAALIAVGLVITRGGGYGLVNPARESMFTRVSRDVRYKAKAFIDTAVWRGGDLMMVSMVAVLVQAGAGVGTFGVIAAGIALAAVLLSWNVEQLLPESPEVPKIKDLASKN
jgi:ATP:ADP antiporter, AAA family